MLANITYKDHKTDRALQQLVGASYGLKARLQKRGIGSPRFTIKSAAASIWTLLTRDNSTKYANIELRKAGIQIGFKSILETYVWAIPYDRLYIQVGREETILTDGNLWIGFTPAQDMQKFLQKIKLDQSAYENTENRRPRKHGSDSTAQSDQ
ncbi:MAG: hypothetical protein KTR24_11410 [Saprospiraceae bacterium]|nr:hypothetical protein [Saprospiraceae bacterium]